MISEARQFQVFSENIRRASIELGIPAIDPEDGLILASIAYLVGGGKRTYVDAGAGIGYSTVWIAYGAYHRCLEMACRIIAIEYEGELANILSRKLEGARDMFGGRIEFEVVEGDALDYFSDLESKGGEAFDMAFVDIEKRDYPNALAKLENLLVTGGVAAFHNAFQPPPPSKFFSMVSKEPWKPVVLPTPAGLLLASKTPHKT
ncbi:O-methyltransferase [Aeropyrum camini]|uniref:Predicted O-methyltransferase n=1 Tax=Aeropyrum camini SY1 = JCM 12091 TaxID=1198449 RepID=U3TDN1_9CREN|nr:class I SAM-dependent methyltransferase [Aeropyrum camini]BAN90551.1 predicted O-methyltransferase [Aeropyrum camini SY1 = JCM 12091]